MEQAKVWKDTRAIMDGACNPSAIARSLVDAADYGREQSGNGMKVQREHEAWAPYRLMLSQLDYLAGRGIGDYPGSDTDYALMSEVES